MRDYCIRVAGPEDLDGARAVMLDTVYRDFGTGYVPRDLAERYPSVETAQLRRVYVRPEHRRRGLARRLVRELLAFAAADGGYRSMYLHTDPAVPGAEDFWRSLGKVVHDEREEPGGGQGIVHFEIPMGR